MKTNRYPKKSLNKSPQDSENLRNQQYRLKIVNPLKSPPQNEKKHHHENITQNTGVHMLL